MGTENKAWKLRVGDKVLVIAGKDSEKGTIGKITKILRNKDLVVVEKANLAKKHVKPNPYKNEQGGIVEKEMPIHRSNVMFVCEACSKPTRIGYKEEGDDKVRYCKKCNAVIKRVKK